MKTDTRLQHALDFAKHRFNVRKRERPAWIYFIRCQQFVKIGVAITMSGRLRALQAGCPFKLSLIHAIKRNEPYRTERQLHGVLKSYRVQGEWFDVPDLVLHDLFKQFISE